MFATWMNRVYRWVSWYIRAKFGFALFFEEWCGMRGLVVAQWPAHYSFPDSEMIVLHHSTWISSHFILSSNLIFSHYLSDYPCALDSKCISN